LAFNNTFTISRLFLLAANSRGAPPFYMIKRAT
jgi:hypothetical protein